MTPPLGRVLPPIDRRDADYPMAMRLQRAVRTDLTRPSRSWVPGRIVLDQGADGACVGFTGANWLQCSPTRTPVSNATGFNLYRECKAIDGIPDVEGTYGRALMKVLQGQGRIGSYLWAEKPLDLQQWLLSTGPVMAGIPWYASMFDPAASGLVDVLGDVVGGHEVLVRAFYRAGMIHRLPRDLDLPKDEDLYRCRNSWGPNWGIQHGAKHYHGEFYIRARDLYRLVFDEGGDAVGAAEIQP